MYSLSIMDTMYLQFQFLSSFGNCEIMYSPFLFVCVGNILWCKKTVGTIIVVSPHHQRNVLFLNNKTGVIIIIIIIIISKVVANVLL
jgi:hypothetical protein